MTIRGGGRPREVHDQAHPYTPDDFAEGPPEPVPARQASSRAYNGRGVALGNGRSGAGRFGFLRFLVFLLVLAGLVLAVLLTVLRPLASGAIIDWAANNPTALGIPFVADMVRADLGDKLTTAPSDDPTQQQFVVAEGDTAATIADKLQTQGFLKDPRAFVFLVTQQNLGSKLQAGTYVLRKNMTPPEIVQGLLTAKVTTIVVQLREGLRLEQITAKLETLPLQMDIEAFYQEATHPPAALLSDYPWLKLPKGATLEGFLGAATYTVQPDIKPDELIRQMLDTFYEQVGPDRMNVAESRGLSFYQVVTLASLVEKEAVVNEERPLIAGVYQNRLNRKMVLNADPSLLYAHDTLQLKAMPLSQWTSYAFWAPWGAKFDQVEFPADLVGYQTYTQGGLMPSPICTPTAASIDAALKPDTKAGYLFFVAKNDGSHTHAFARTYQEHLANLSKYGYR
ncbi:MAG: endolytic transglycosylase MltG [Chloroflexi bacterium]|nr:MAG: endolytic transglycosylase MltG [Chloroflexota bacterium]